MTDRSNEHRKAGERRRLAAALRDNLRRRKAQAKRRNEGRKADGRRPPADTPGEPHDSAGIDVEK